MLLNPKGNLLHERAGKLLPLLFIPLLAWAFKDEFLSIKGMDFLPLQEGLLLFALLLIGMVLNWGTEAWKWHLLGKENLGLNYKNALKGVMAGRSIGMWMPGRVGAWLGKLFFVRKEERSRALYPLMVSAGAQFTATLAFAGSALLLHGSLLSAIPVAEGALDQAFLYASLFPFLALFLYLFLRSERARGFFRWAGFPSHEVLSVRDIPASLYAKVFGIAVLRYLVFLGQFALVLRFLIPEIALAHILVGVPLVLLMVSVLPSMVLAKLGVREWVMVAVMAPLVGHEQELILASFSIWLVNLAIPAIAGVFVFLTAPSSDPAEAKAHAVH